LSVTTSDAGRRVSPPAPPEAQTQPLREPRPRGGHQPGPARNFDELPVLDLSGEGPLPFDLNEIAAAVPLAGPRPGLAAYQDNFDGTSFAGFATEFAESFPATGTQRAAEPRLQSADGSLWLSGDVLMCACPDCKAPMSVRIWLMVAECWRCATVVELTEEQEREARQLIRRREELRQSATPPPPPAEKAAPSAPAQPRDEPVLPRPGAKQPLREPPPPPPASPRPKPERKRAAPRGYAAARNRLRRQATASPLAVFFRTLFRDMPAWLISLLIHMAALTLFALLTYGDTEEEPFVLLSLDPSHIRDEGESKNAVVLDKVRFELPVPTEKIPKTEAAKEALIVADQDARELRLDPDAPFPQLPEVNDVKQKLTTSTAGTRMLMARDPRLRVEVVKNEGGTTLTEAAVSRGLRWMAEQQNQDGGWGLSGGKSDSAGASLALLPFLGAGQTHQVGRYKDHVAHGLRWMLEHQKESGDLRVNVNRQHGMYAHGQAAIVLCEAFKMTGDEQLRAAAQRSIDFIVKAQHPAGGWRYEPGEAGDLSVTGWQLMALQSARAAQLDVPQETLDRAAAFMDSVSVAGGAQYQYTPGGRINEAMTAEGLLSRMYLGWNLRLNPELSEGIEWLSENHPPHAGQSNMYYWYYATQAMHHHGGPAWERWNLKMRDILVNTQETRDRDAGSWTPRGQHDRTGGRLYMTSLAVCTLEIYYRHAPLFRQIKLD